MAGGPGGRAQALGAPRDEPNEHEREAAGSLAAVGLALLRTRVVDFSGRDESALRYESAGAATAKLLALAAPDRIELVNAEILAADPARGLAGAATAAAAERAIADALRRPKGPERAVRLLGERHDVRAKSVDERTVELLGPLPKVAEPLLLRTLALADDPGPLYVRGRKGEGPGGAGRVVGRTSPSSDRRATSNRRPDRGAAVQAS